MIWGLRALVIILLVGLSVALFIEYRLPRSRLLVPVLFAVGVVSVLLEQIGVINPRTTWWIAGVCFGSAALIGTVFARTGKSNRTQS